MTTKLFFALLTVTVILIFDLTINAQCGPAGTAPCPKNKNAAQKKSRSRKVTGKPIDFAELRRKLIGKWSEERYEGELTYTFSDDNTGRFADAGKVCQEFTYSLLKDILIISNRSVGKCGTGSGIDKWKISIIKNELRMIMVGEDGKPVTDEDGVHELIWKRAK